jgi:hypothetical protein
MATIVLFLLSQRLSDRRLLANLMPTFADRGVLRSQGGRSPTVIISIFWTEASNISFK